MLLDNRPLSELVDFESVLKDKRKLVWQELQYCLNNYLKPLLKKYSRNHQSEFKFHWGLVNEYPQRLGKYLRPSLMLLTAEAMGVPKEKVLKVAAAMQLSEDWLLIHDDFEDGSLERRGGLTLHRLYSSELAVNAGDALHILMWKILSSNIDTLGPEITWQLLEEFYQMLSRTALGQTVEIKWTQENRMNLTDEDWFFIADGKTSYYTIAGPMRLGAIIAGVSASQMASLFKFGNYLGRCFQIVDDILDLTADFKGLKKQRGNDIYEGKRTIILSHLLRNASDKDKAKLKRIFVKARSEIQEIEVSWVIERMHHYGSIRYAQDIAKKLARLSYDIFETELKFLQHEPARSQLRAGINFILRRDF